MKYDYYTIELPGDLVDFQKFKGTSMGMAMWTQDMGHHAIAQAAERTKLFCMPCEWTAKLVSGGPDCFNCVFRVRRKRS